MDSERARMGWGVVLALAVAGGLAFQSVNLRWQDGPDARPYAGDFIHEYSTAWMVVHGEAGRLYDFASVHAVQHDRDAIGFAWDAASVNVPYYPPPYYALIAPLAWLDYRDAAHAWLALQFAALVAAAWLLAAAHPPLRRAFWWALPAALLFPPMATGWVSGQKGALWLLVFAAIHLLLQRGRATAAGAVFGLLALKPPLALALGAVMLARREWRFLAGAVATGLALLAISLPLGLDAWTGWGQAMLDPVAQDRASLLGKAHCWLGFARVVLGSYAGLGVTALTLALDALTLVALLPAWRAAGDDPTRRGLAFAATVAATVLVSPHLYAYDLTVLLAIFAIVGAAVADGRLPAAHGARLRRLLLGVFLGATAATTGHPAALVLSVPLLFAAQWAIGHSVSAGQARSFA